MYIITMCKIISSRLQRAHAAQMHAILYKYY